MNFSLFLAFVSIMFAACVMSYPNRIWCMQKCGHYRIRYGGWTIVNGRWVISRQVYYYTSMCFRKCPTVDCKWSEWKAVGDPTECSVTCETGVKYQRFTRTIVQYATGEGKPCNEQLEKYNTITCDLDYCPETVCKTESIPKENGHAKHYQDCNKFVQCQTTGTGHSYIAHEMPCSPGTAWDDTKFGCTKDGLDKCEGVKCKAGEYFRNETHCSGFFICDHNKLHPKTCQDPAPYWDQKAKTCSKDKRVCEDSTDSTENICREMNNGLVKHPNSKVKYYHCSNGLPYEMSCPSGLVFNEYTKNCDQPTG